MLTGISVDTPREDYIRGRIRLMITREHEIDSTELNKWINLSIQNSLVLSKIVQKMFDLQSGKKVTSYWRSGFEDTMDFYEHGCLCREYPGIENEAKDWIAKKCLNYLDSDPKKICIFEDWTWTDKTADIYKDPTIPPFFTSEICIDEGYEIYYFADSENASHNLIQKELDLAGSAGPYCVGVLGEKPKEIKIQKGIRVSEKILETIARSTEFLIFGAFDLEGFVWVQINK